MAVRHKIDDHTTHKKKQQQTKETNKYISIEKKSDRSFANETNKLTKTD